MNSVRLFILTALATLLLTPGLIGQINVHFAYAPIERLQVARVQMTPPPQLRTDSSNVRIAGFPGDPTQLPYSLVATPANDAWVRDITWAAYDAIRDTSRQQRIRTVWRGRSRTIYPQSASPTKG
jgi:hypothetical protein